MEPEVEDVPWPTAWTFMVVAVDEFEFEDDVVDEDAEENEEEVEDEGGNCGAELTDKKGV